MNILNGYVVLLMHKVALSILEKWMMGLSKALVIAKKLLEDIPNKIRDILGIIVDVNLLSENGKEYIEIITSPSSFPISYKGQYHYRTGSTKQELKGNALNQFLLKKMNINWEDALVDNLSVDELINDSFMIFKENAIRSRRMNEQDLNISNRELLEKLELIEDGKLTRAGVLLFHHKAEKWAHGAHIKIGYFSSGAEIEYQDEIYGSLLYQAQNAIDLLYLKYLKAQISYDGIHRVETYPYPKEAIREAILNAIAHKNYERQVPIQIKVFDDKIIIANTCVFPEGWTEKNLF